MKPILLTINTDIEKMSRDELVAAVKRGLAREDAMSSWISDHILADIEKCGVQHKAESAIPPQLKELTELRAAFDELKREALPLQKANTSLEQRNAKRIKLTAKLKSRIAELQSLVFKP